MADPSVTHRRALHRLPELDDRLPETAAYLRAALEPLGCEISSPTPGSVCAWFDGGRDETVAVRADMDALPVTEATGLPFASVHPGVMHACGHDGHMAMALALTEHLAARRGGLPRNVLFLFQPAEETTGGAKALCDSGILEKYNVTRLFGVHLWPGLPAGKVYCRPGPMMARSSEVTVKLTGRSVHITRWREGCDALAAGMEFLRLAYDLAAALPADPPSLLRFGKMTSGTVRNALSGETALEGTFRTYREETFNDCRRLLADIGQAVADRTGCAVEVRCSEGYPAVWNDEALYGAVCAGLGPDRPAPLPEPVLGADDFSFYQKRVPGLYFFLGTGDTPALHAPEFTFDDELVLPAGVAFWKKLIALP